MDENVTENASVEEQSEGHDDSSTNNADSPEENAEQSTSPQPDARDWARIMDEAERLQKDEPETVQESNQKHLGQVTLHYASRDVKLLLDGDSAIRLLTMFRERSEGHWSDYLNPYISTAERGWIVLDLTEPLAISYLPLGDPPKRTAIDPAVYAANNGSASL